MQFSSKHPDALVPLMNWFKIAKHATWNDLTDVRKDFGHADVVGRRTVFNVKGNQYRLITRINYRTGRVFILYVLTHDEYAKGRWKDERRSANQ